MYSCFFVVVFFPDLRRFRTYQGTHVRDLLRAMRNKVRYTRDWYWKCTMGPNMFATTILRFSFSHKFSTRAEYFHSFFNFCVPFFGSIPFLNCFVCIFFHSCNYRFRNIITESFPSTFNCLSAHFRTVTSSTLIAGSQSFLCTRTQSWRCAAKRRYSSHTTQRRTRDQMAGYYSDKVMSSAYRFVPVMIAMRSQSSKDKRLRDDRSRVISVTRKELRIQNLVM